jgi:16S rRNA (guanine527-N7)-methyltransferase
MGYFLSMDSRRIAELLTPFLVDPLAPSQLDRISIYIDLLLRWNARVNLTAVRTPEEIVTRHFGESLFAASHLLPKSPAAVDDAPPLVGAPGVPPAGSREARPASPPATGHVRSDSSISVSQNLETKATPQPPGVIDLGSGAGFPGLPMKIWSPGTAFTLIESNHKKVAFLREVIRALTLTGIDVFPQRVEDHPTSSATLVTLRAVERFETILPTAASLVAPGGHLALLIGSSQIATAQDLLPNFIWPRAIPIPQSATRVLQVASHPSL